MAAITVLRGLELMDDITNSNMTNDAKMDLFKLLEFHEEFRVEFDESEDD